MSTGRIVLAAVAGMLVVPVLAFALVQAAYLFDRDDAATAAQERLEATARVAEVTDAIRSEQAGAVLSVIDGPPSPSEEGAVQRTDEAIAALRTDLDRWSEATAAPYLPAVDSLDELDLIRADIAMAPERSLAEVGAGLDMAARYDTPLLALHDAARQATLSIDDLEERRGAALLSLLSRQTLNRDQLGRILASLDGGTADTPEEIRTLAAQYGTWTSGLATIGEAEEPYASLVAEHLPAEQADHLATLVDGVLQAGDPVDPTDLELLFDTGASMADLEMAVTERHEAIVAAAVAEVEDDDRQALVLGGAALLTALALAVLAVAAVLTGRRSPPGPAGPAETASPSPLTRALTDRS